MRTIETQVYSFNELSERAQQTAIENNYDINVFDSFWYEDTEEAQRFIIENKGFTDVDIRFSGFSSQGDGASFTGFVDLEKFIIENGLNDKYKRILPFIGNGIDYNGEITRSGRHVHERSTSLYLSADVRSNPNNDYKNIYALLDNLETEIEETIIDLSKQAYKALNDCYKHLTSDEAIKETLIANEYEFTIDGENI